MSRRQLPWAPSRPRALPWPFPRRHRRPGLAQAAQPRPRGRHTCVLTALRSCTWRWHLWPARCTRRPGRFWKWAGGCRCPPSCVGAAPLAGPRPRRPGRRRWWLPQRLTGSPAWRRPARPPRRRRVAAAPSRRKTAIALGPSVLGPGGRGRGGRRGGLGRRFAAWSPVAPRRWPLERRRRQVWARRGRAAGESLRRARRLRGRRRRGMRPSARQWCGRWRRWRRADIVGYSAVGAVSRRWQQGEAPHRR